MVTPQAKTEIVSGSSPDVAFQHAEVGLAQVVRLPVGESALSQSVQTEQDEISDAVKRPAQFNAKQLSNIFGTILSEKGFSNLLNLTDDEQAIVLEKVEAVCGRHVSRSTDINKHLMRFGRFLRGFSVTELAKETECSTASMCLSVQIVGKAVGKEPEVFRMLLEDVGATGLPVMIAPKNKKPEEPIKIKPVENTTQIMESINQLTMKRGGTYAGINELTHHLLGWQVDIYSANFNDTAQALREAVSLAIQIVRGYKQVPHSEVLRPQDVRWFAQLLGNPVKKERPTRLDTIIERHNTAYPQHQVSLADAQFQVAGAITRLKRTLAGR